MAARQALACPPNAFRKAVLGPMPHLYPFIVNDPARAPGEAARPSRHHRPLDPAADRAGSYGVQASWNG